MMVEKQVLKVCICKLRGLRLLRVRRSFFVLLLFVSTLIYYIQCMYYKFYDTEVFENHSELVL